MDLPLLNQWQQLAFCASLCERSFPNYELFCELEEIDAKPSRKILNKVWEFLRGQLKSLKNMEKQLEHLTDLIPDPDQFEQYGVYPAMDTALALQSCVQAILDSSIGDAENIQSLMHARLEEVLEMQDIKQADSELWQRQLDLETSVYELITSKTSHADMVKTLIPMSQGGGVSSLGICLNDNE
jgi:uncharacterized protein YjaG (DUF416 family)